VVITAFTRGHPNSYGYATVNVNAGERNLEAAISLRERFRILWSNLTVVVGNCDFWLCGVFAFMMAGPFTSMASYWGGPYLRDVFGYSNAKVGRVLTSMSIGQIAGCLTTPVISDWLGTRKWLLFVATLIALATQVMLLFLTDSLKEGHLWALFFVFAYCTNSLGHVLYAMVREYSVSAVAATTVGCINAFSFVGGAVDGQVTGAIIASFGTVDGEKYSKKAYEWGLLFFAMSSLAVATLMIGLAKDTDLTKNKGQESLPSGESA
jgi:nitrate/nitrite transporter NarK